MLPEKLTVECIASISLRQRQLAEHEAEQDRQEAADHRGLGRGDDAEIEPAERAGDQHEERHDVGERAQHLADVARALLLRRDARHELRVHARYRA